MFGLDEASGEIALSKKFSIHGNMPCKALRAGLKAHTGKTCTADDPQHPTVLLSHAFSLQGLRAACVCFLRGDTLRTVELHLSGGTAQKQRETLFRCLGARDACADRMQSVYLRYPFGTAWIAEDLRSGGAVLRITYSGKE